MADEQKQINIDDLNRENLVKMTVEQLHELKAYMTTIRQKLLSKMEIVATVCEEAEAKAAVLKKAQSMPASEREALKQVLNGDHFKEPGKTESGETK